MRGAVFFDRDGTLNVDDGYTHQPEALEWLEGAREAVRLVNQSGLVAVVATNQAGIARGYFDEAAMHRFHARMQLDLAAIGARIDAFYFCPHHADAAIDAYRHPNHPDRKPNPGMILRAIRELKLDPSKSVLIGDHRSDIEAAHAAGIRGVLADGRPLDHIVKSALRL